MVKSKQTDKIELLPFWRGKSGQKYTLCDQSMTLDSSLGNEGLFVCNIRLIYKLPRFANNRKTLTDFYTLRWQYKRDGFCIEVTPGGWADEKCRTYEMMVSWAAVKIPKT